jgi:hypothetical protein
MIALENILLPIPEDYKKDDSNIYGFEILEDKGTQEIELDYKTTSILLRREYINKKRILQNWRTTQSLYNFDDAGQPVQKEETELRSFLNPFIGHDKITACLYLMNEFNTVGVYADTGNNEPFYSQMYKKEIIEDHGVKNIVFNLKNQSVFFLREFISNDNALKEHVKSVLRYIKDDFGNQVERSQGELKAEFSGYFTPEQADAILFIMDW